MKGSIIAKIAVRFVTAISTTGGKDEQHQYRKPLDKIKDFKPLNLIDIQARNSYSSAMNKKIISVSLICIVLVFGITSYDTAQNGLPKIAENTKLAEHYQEFEKKIYKVAKKGTTDIYARHYYLTEALEMRDKFVAQPKIKPDPQAGKTEKSRDYIDGI